MVSAARAWRRVSATLIIRRVNQDAGFFMKPWARDRGFMTTGKWKPFLRPSLSFAPNSLQFCPHEREIPPIHFCPFWGSLTLEKKQPQPPGTLLTSRGCLTGAVVRLCGERCLPSRERCPICVPGRRVCKDHFTCISWRIVGVASP